MKVTLVSLRPTESALAAGRPALTPELLAATGARYSRNNEGLEAILARIDPEHPDRSVDSIFRMIDYGHQSIADMAPVAMFMDGLSLWLAYHIWSLCPTAGGQESSTRYLKLSLAGVVEPARLGLAEGELPRWREGVEQAFARYQQALGLWQEVAEQHPELVRFPAALAEDRSEKAARQRERMRRNFAFDRARNFIPAAAATNVMLIMSARGWVQLCQALLSHPLPEAQAAGEAIAGELELSAPRLLKHARAQPSLRQGWAAEWQGWQALAEGEAPGLDAGRVEPAAPGEFLEAQLPPGVTRAQVAEALRFHEHRYAWLGSPLARTAVRFGWQAVGFAEIRDLNRHRTGSKYCPLVPAGFYAAAEQVETLPAPEKVTHALASAAAFGVEASARARARLREGDPAFVYYTLLGTQFPFEHTTTADKFIYEAELRTGTGSHYRYADHLRAVLQLWYQRFPETRGMILEGSAEPE